MEGYFDFITSHLIFFIRYAIYFKTLNKVSKINELYFEMVSFDVQIFQVTGQLMNTLISFK